MRHFYIIGHNPDTVDKAKSALPKGANALEPDITWNDDHSDFFVYDSNDPFAFNSKTPSLANYCFDLARELLNDLSLNLALITWDMKNSENQNFDFSNIQEIINENFTSRLAAKNYEPIPMLFTTPDNFHYLTTYAAPYLTDTQAIGTDNFDNAGHAENYYKSNGPPPYAFAFADGADYWRPEKVFDSIQSAISLRNTGHSFSFVHVWTVNDPLRWLLYLNLGIDGILTDNPSDLSKMLSLPPFAEQYKLATRSHNPFAPPPIAPNFFNVKTYSFVPGEMFIAVNKGGKDGAGVLVKIKDEGGEGHNMFAIQPDGKGGYKTVPNYGPYLLGYQEFNSFIVDIIYIPTPTLTILIALGDGKILRVNGTGGTGANMFLVDEYIDYFTASQNASYYGGDQKFNKEITLLTQIDNSVLVGFADGKLLKVLAYTNYWGYKVHNMWGLQELPNGFEPFGEFVGSPSYAGDAKFNSYVKGMRIVTTPQPEMMNTIANIQPIGNMMNTINNIPNKPNPPDLLSYTFIWFGNGKLLKIDNNIAEGWTPGGYGHNMFNIVETDNGFSPAIGIRYYVGDAKFSSNINTILVAAFTNIGFDNGKILVIAQAGGAGTGTNMFQVAETSNGFHNLNPKGAYVGDAYFEGYSIGDMIFVSYKTPPAVLNEYILVGMTFKNNPPNIFMPSYPGGSVIKIPGFGAGEGSNMWKIIQLGPTFLNMNPNMGYMEGDQYFPYGGVSGLNFINGILFVELYDNMLLKINLLGGTGQNMFAVTMTPNSFIPLPGYNYYLGEQYFN